jgi:hypothetical protein
MQYQACKALHHVSVTQRLRNLLGSAAGKERKPPIGDKPLMSRHYLERSSEKNWDGESMLTKWLSSRNI